MLVDEVRQTFDESLALARTVFPYVENHNFYIDHRYMTIFWNKVREFGALLAQHGFLIDSEDVFYLRHDEVRSALEELRLFWSSGGAGAARGPGHWPPLVERRKSIHGAMRQWSPPPALGQVSEGITEPFTVMLWGITTERMQEWLSSDRDGRRELTGIAGSPGVAEGSARVILHPDQLSEIKQGEILVTPTTANELDTGLRSNRGDRDRRRRHHVPCGHRRPRVRPAGGRRHRQCDEADQDRRPAARRCRRWRGNDRQPPLT